MQPFTHIVLTRFNVRVNYSASRTGIDPDWLAHRFQLFEQFCYPSMRSQVNQNFKWLVFFDSETPIAFKQKIAGYAEWHHFIPVYVDGEFTSALNRTTVLAHLPQDTEFLITTRLDNDDAVSRDFIEVIQANFWHQSLEFINLTNGYVWSDGRLYSFQYLKNPFMSLIERIQQRSLDGFKTVLCGEHTQLAAIGAIKQVKTVPTWLQVVHGKNVSNRIRGVREPVQKLGERFFIDRQDIPLSDPLLSYWMDRSFTLAKVPLEAVATLLPISMKTQLRKLLFNSEKEMVQPESQMN
jgi:hypothetical protein